MLSTRLHQRPATRSLVSEATPSGTARHPEGLRPRPRLRLVWSADQVADQPTPASRPVQAFALHQGAACRLFSLAPIPTSSAPCLRERWVLEFEPTRRQEPDRLIGWIGSNDPDSVVTLHFPTKEAAIAFCERKGMTYSVSEPQGRAVKPKSYAENFIRKT